MEQMAANLPLRLRPTLPGKPPDPCEPRPLAEGRPVSTHDPIMPIWTCGGCGLPWPCRTRQRELRAEFEAAPVSLALYLGSYLVAATEDLTWIPASALHQRFLGWTRSR